MLSLGCVFILSVCHFAAGLMHLISVLLLHKLHVVLVAGVAQLAIVVFSIIGIRAIFLLRKPSFFESRMVHHLRSHSFVGCVGGGDSS